MKSHSFGAVLLTLVGACSSRHSPASKALPDTMSSMAGMPGMAGTAMPAKGDSGTIAIDRSAAAREGISFALAAVRLVRGSVLLAGTLAYPEPNRQIVTARVSGWVDKLDADYEGKPVRTGDPLLTLYAPELVGAEEEYLTARRLNDSALTVAARRRLALWELPTDQVAAIESSGVASRTMVLRAPRNGEIAQKMVTAGQAVHPGDVLFVIADRSTLWVNTTVHEMDAPLVHMGTSVTITIRALPGRTWRGRVIFLQPVADSATRTLTARVEVPNGGGQLRPGMYAAVDAAPRGVNGLSVPLAAVLPTGRHNLVFVNRGDGRFVPREVQVGARGDSLIQILHGLRAGDEVVASAVYLIDSESNLAAAMQGLMLQMGMGLDMGGMRTPRKDTTR